MWLGGWFVVTKSGGWKEGVVSRRFRKLNLRLTSLVETAPIPSIKFGGNFVSGLSHFQGSLAHL